MSKKKEIRIRRLQRLPLWPAVLEMFITEFIILSLALIICFLAIGGIVNSLVLNNAKECRTVVKAVNENWNKESRGQIRRRLSNFADSYDDISEINFDDNSGSLAYISKYPDFFTEESQRIFNKAGMIHFIDPRYGQSFLHLLLNNKLSERELYKSFENEYMEDEFLLNPGKMFRSIDIIDVLKDDRFLSWATNESIGLHTVSIYKTEIPDINLCFNVIYKLNTFQFNLICTIVIFFIVVFIFSGIFELAKVIKLVHERKRVNMLVTIDTVTGGYNKDYFIQKAGKEIARGRNKYALVQLRLEKYRNYCTAYGLKQGENLLEELNANIAEMLGKKEIAAHVEKSDFALLLKYQDEETLNIRLKNLMNILREKRGGQHLTFSAGVCPVKSRQDDVSGILTFAGIAVPKSIKIQDEIVWFNDSMKEEQVWERRIEDDMEQALENHEFKVYLQPKYSTKGEKLAAAEALVRWIHPVLGFISPGKFIPIFERNGFILQLDDYMLNEIANLQSEWEAQGKKLVPISVNVSRAHFAEENLAEHICSVVDKYKVPHKYIELELTESAFFDDKAVLLNTVKKLKNFGFKVSMDDFGAGYSSLNSLKELPLDIIKLDAEFFRSVDDVTRSNLIVGETISLAKKLGMEIVAEGIETREQVDFLAKQDCDLIQGFYFSKPLPVEEFEQKAWS